MLPVKSDNGLLKLMKSVSASLLFLPKKHFILMMHNAMNVLFFVEMSLEGEIRSLNVLILPLLIQ